MTPSAPSLPPSLIQPPSRPPAGLSSFPRRAGLAASNEEILGECF